MAKGQFHMVTDGGLSVAPYDIEVNGTEFYKPGDGLDGSFGSVPLQSDDGDKSYQDDGRERRSPAEEKE